MECLKDKKTTGLRFNLENQSYLQRNLIEIATVKKERLGSHLEIY